jgi:hypothetical protein
LIFPATPSQTVGPYFASGLPWPDGPYAVPAATPAAVRISGTVFDGDGEPVPDHMIESGQADPESRFADLHGHGGGSQLEGFRGFARCGYEDGDGTAATRPSPSNRARSPVPAVCSRRRTSTSPCSPAARCSRSPPTMDTDSTSTSRAPAETVFFAL